MNAPGTTQVNMRLVAWWTLVMFLMLAAPTWLMSLLVYHGELKDEKDQLRELTAAKARALKSSIQNELNNVLDDVHWIAGSTELIEMIERPTRHNRDHLVSAWMHFATERRLYDQVRYIDDQGREVVRIDTAGGMAREVPAGQLQDKSKRYYFKEGLVLDPGQTYVSPFDLNRERGELETPHKPVIRFVNPVFDRAGNRRGLAVLNYLGARLLQQLRSPEYAGQGRFLLVNSDGYYLRGFREADEWGFMFEDAAHRGNLARDHPHLWELIRRNEDGQYADESGWFVYKRISFPQGVDHRLPNLRREWVLLNFMAEEQLQAYFKPLREAALKLNILVTPVFLLAALLLAYFGQHRRQSIEVLRLSATAFDTQEAIVVTDQRKQVMQVNKAFSRITGYGESEALSRDLSFLLGNRQDDELASMGQKLQTHGHWTGELQITTRDGTNHPTRQMVTAVRDLQGEVRNYVYQFFDITEELAAKRQLEKLAVTDELTGLYNRRYLEAEYRRELRRCQRFEHPMALILADIDHFKQVNDEFGHARGDAVLQEVATILRGRLRDTDTVARWGGEEFIILLPETDLDGAARLADTLRRAVEDRRCGDLPVTISAGVAEHGPLEATQRFFERLDHALYSAKRGGRNKVVLTGGNGLAACR